MIKRNNKKGFTIVELVIVIAVIAILAAVLIPTFAGIIKKAQESSDVQLAKNFNTALAAEEAATGKKPATFAAVLNVLTESGYNIEKLNPTADGNWFAWDEVTNQILYLDAEYNVISSAKDLDASADSIDDGKWHFAVSDAESFATVGKSTSNVYFIGMNVEKGDDVTLDLTGAAITQSISTATPIYVTEGGTLNIVGGTVTATGETVGDQGKVYKISVCADGGELNMNGTTLSGMTADGKIATPICYTGGATGTITNVTVDSVGGTPAELNGGCNVAIVGGTYTTTDYWSGSLFVSGSYNETDTATKVTVQNAKINVKGNTQYLFTVYGSDKGASLTLDNVDIDFENEPTEEFFYLVNKYTLTIKNGTTFNDKVLTVEEWENMGYNAAEVDGAIVISN